MTVLTPEQVAEIRKRLTRCAACGNHRQITDLEGQMKLLSLNAVEAEKLLVDSIEVISCGDEACADLRRQLAERDVQIERLGAVVDRLKTIPGS